MLVSELSTDWRYAKLLGCLNKKTTSRCPPFDKIHRKNIFYVVFQSRSLRPGALRSILRIPYAFFGRPCFFSPWTQFKKIPSPTTWWQLSMFPSDTLSNSFLKIFLYGSTDARWDMIFVIRSSTKKLKGTVASSNMNAVSHRDFFDWI